MTRGIFSSLGKLPRNYWSTLNYIKSRKPQQCSGNRSSISWGVGLFHIPMVRDVTRQSVQSGLGEQILAQDSGSDLSLEFL